MYILVVYKLFSLSLILFTAKFSAHTVDDECVQNYTISNDFCPLEHKHWFKCKNEPKVNSIELDFMIEKEKDEQVSIIEVDEWQDIEDSESTHKYLINEINELKNKNQALQHDYTQIQKNTSEIIQSFEKSKLNSKKIIEILTRKIESLHQNLSRLNYKLKLSNPHVIDKLKNQIKSSKYQLIELNNSASDLISLPNDQLLVIFNGASMIALYDKSLSLIKTVNKINNAPFTPYKVASNHMDRLYLSDLLNDRILMLDFELNFLKQTTTSTRLFSNPNGLSYYNAFLYVCDPFNKRIHRFDKNLEQFTSWILDFTPYQVQIANNYICIEGHNPRSIRFYDMNFKLIRKYDGLFGDILAYHTTILLHSFTTHSFFVFEYNGLLDEEIHTNGFDCLNDDWNHGMTIWNQANLLITTRPKSQLILV